MGAGGIIWETILGNPVQIRYFQRLNKSRRRFSRRWFGGRPNFSEKNRI